jgi:hypothetical protein
VLRETGGRVDVVDAVDVVDKLGAIVATLACCGHARNRQGYCGIACFAEAGLVVPELPEGIGPIAVLDPLAGVLAHLAAELRVRC